MERIAMSQKERDKLEWLKRAKDRVISQREAAERIGVSDRWVRKLLKRMKQRGDRVVVHGLRGRASNRKIPADARAFVLDLLKQPDWHDFGPTFASEQLAKRHGVEVSDETLRGWMIEAGCGRLAGAKPKTCIAGGLGGADSANWCNGTPPSTTGWKDADRCVTWCA